MRYYGNANAWGYNGTAYLSHENITIRHMNVKINIIKPKTNKKLKKC